MLFVVERKKLVKYFNQSVNLRTLVKDAPFHWLLDTRELDREPAFLARETKYRAAPRTLRRVELEDLEDYMPSTKSFFNPKLTSDIDLSQDFVPSEYAVPIKGDAWFAQDFETLFNVHERLYAFFYATGPRFVRGVADTLSKVLRSPWRGGFSRVNMYENLSRVIPGIHAPKVERVAYASPGSVRFEAVQAIGDSIRVATLSYLDHGTNIEESAKAIRKLLRSRLLNKLDTSGLADEQLPMEKVDREALQGHCNDIAVYLHTRPEFQTLREIAPNVVVFSKAVLTFIKQAERLAQFQAEDMLDYKDG